MRFSTTIPAICAALALSLAADAASAACTRLAFSVNDYGKDGPAKDAKALLDKYAAKWTAERGIKKFTVGKKDVTCELFLDVGLFDEYTCKAAASVCWEGSAMPVDAAAPAMGVKTKSAAAPGTAKAAAAKSAAPKTTGSIPTKAPAAAAPAAPAAQVPKPQ